MADIQIANKLRQHIADWSDAKLAEARAFVASHSELIPREMNNAQLYGILTIARNIKRNDKIIVFFERQAIKAGRAGKSKENVRDFWHEIKTRFTGFYPDAKKIATATNPAWANNEEEIAKIQRQLLLKFMQHTIAEKQCLERLKK